MRSASSGCSLASDGATVNSVITEVNVVCASMSTPRSRPTISRSCSLLRGGVSNGLRLSSPGSYTAS